MALRSRGFVRSKRRKAEWADTMVRTRITTGGATQSVGAIAVGGAFTESVTIARVRGNVLVSLDVGAIADSAIVGLGLIVVKENAFTVGGSASMPSPTDDMNSSWLYHQLFQLGIGVGTAQVNDLGALVARAEIDVKAMRKVGPDDILAFIWDAIILAGSPTFDGMAAVRTMALLA